MTGTGRKEMLSSGGKLIKENGSKFKSKQIKAFSEEALRSHRGKETDLSNSKDLSMYNLLIPENMKD